MTIPGLITKINDRVTDNSKKVFNAKMVKGFNLTKAAGELNNTYSSTYDFLTNGLSKHLKITKICDSSHIRECLPYDNIKYDKDENTEKTYEVSKLNTSKSLNLEEKDGYKDSAAFVLGDGTVVVGSYNLGCIVDDGKLDKTISSCFDGLYDLNGSRKPNKLGKDILPIRSAGINAGPAVLATLGGVKIISNAQVYDGIPTSTYCDTSDSNSANWTVKSEYSKYGITKCCTLSTCTSTDAGKGDRWAAAAVACGDMGGRLPKEEELAAMASELYSATLDTSKIPEPLSGLGSSWYFLWSSVEYPSDSHYAYGRYFSSSDSGRYYDYRYGSNIRAVCVAD